MISGVGHNILPFFLLITPIVFFHELGHFLVARACGVRIETFSIGFGPEIFGWNDRTGTRWKIAWIPLGGYVKFFGDTNAASVPDHETLESMTAKDRLVAFPLKPLYQRALIVAAGPAANFVLAIVILTSFLVVLGTYAVAPVVSKVVPASAAAQAGFQAGDTILTIDGNPIESFDQIRSQVWDRSGEVISVTVNRAGKMLLLHVTPRLKSVSILGETQNIGQLGIEASTSPSQLKHIRYGLPGAIAEASSETWSIVSTTLDYLRRVITGHASYKELHGPVGIAKLAANVAAVSFLDLVRMAAFISVSVGLVNIFPIPILDGGHLLYYGYEALAGRPLGAKAQDVGFRLGMVLILGLLLLVTWNDLLLPKLF
jgi:regulator of sigma E protease